MSSYIASGAGSISPGHPSDFLHATAHVHWAHPRNETASSLW